MDLGLLAEVAGLGLAAVDVVGIAFMPILLAQRDGLRRALVFLLGSFVALVAMGLVFTTGVGTVVADFNERYPWLEPGVEVFGVLTYAVTALLIQSAVVAAYLLTPHQRRDHVMGDFAGWLARRGEFWAGVVSVALGVGLLIFAGPDFAAALG
jgi:hypothetical protein